MTDDTQAAPDAATQPTPVGPAAAPVEVGLVIVVEARRIPGDFVFRPWMCVVSCPGKAAETTSRRFTRDGACRVGRRVAGHLASGRRFRVVWR